MERRTSIVYKVLGTIFLLCGVITVLNVLAAFELTHTLLWRDLFYGIADLALASGCLMRERWVVWAFGLNFCALFLLVALEWFAAGVFPLQAFVVAAAAGIIAIFAYMRKKFLCRSVYHGLVGVLFFIAWGGALIYTLTALI